MPSKKNPNETEATTMVASQNKPEEEPMVPTPKSSKEAEDYALGLVQQLDQRRLNVDRLEINVDGQTVFKMKEGNIGKTKTPITQEHTELLKKALSDPASLQGTVKITQGNQVLLHVKNGRVLIDSAGLVKESAKVEVKSQEGMYQKYAENVKSKGLQATKEVAKNALTNGEERTDVVEMLKGKDPAYEKMSTEQGEQTANQTLDQIVNSAEAQVKQKAMQSAKSQEETQKVAATKSR